MSLARALADLQLDVNSERVLRDILVLFSHHPREPFGERDVAFRTGHPREAVRDMLPALSRAFVLDFDSTSDAYTFSGDVVLGFEIDAFKRRVDGHQGHMTSNVARFRERQGF